MPTHNITRTLYLLDKSIEIDVYNDKEYLWRGTIGEFIKENEDVMDNVTLRRIMIHALSKLSRENITEFDDFYSGKWTFKRVNKINNSFSVKIKNK